MPNKRASTNQRGARLRSGQVKMALQPAPAAAGAGAGAGAGGSPASAAVQSRFKFPDGLKPVPEHVLVFSEEHPQLAMAIEHTSRLLTAAGFVVRTKKNRGITGKKKVARKMPKTSLLPPHVLKISCLDRSPLDEQAEALQLWKQTHEVDSKTMKKVAWTQKFERARDDDNWDPFDTAVGPEFVCWDKPDHPEAPHDPKGFYAPRERSELITSALEAVHIDEQFADAFKVDLAKVHGTGVTLLAELRRQGVLDSSFPLHDSTQASAVLKSSIKSIIKMPVDDIRHYYGEQVAFYSLFMNWFTMWLFPPGILGAVLYWHRVSSDIDIDDSPYTPVFALFVVLWAVFGLVQWRRRCSVHAFRWNTLEHEGQEHVRSDFTGTERLSPVTGRPELHYPSWRRRLKYIVSFGVTFVMLGIAFAVMVCSLNLQGYIHSHESVFHIRELHQFSTPGAVFDPNGPFLLTLVPVLLHTTVILVLNQLVYRNIATALTNWENHRTAEDYENALILKRFFFEAFDCYIALFYLAFYEQNIVLLRQELVALYSSDSIRRVMTESVLPLGIQWLSGKLSDDDTASGAGSDKVDSPSKWTRKLNFWSVSAQIRRDELEMFDDYLEMIIEFGYITMFASAFPLAAALSIVCNVIEVHSDAFKLAYLSRRPTAGRVRNMGAWEHVLECQVWISILTNTLIFGMASDQIVAWIPALFKEVHLMSGEEDMVLVSGAGRYLVGILWAVEHVLLLAALAITKCVSAWPKWLRTAVERRRYKEHVAKLDGIREKLRVAPATPRMEFSE